MRPATLRPGRAASVALVVALGGLPIAGRAAPPEARVLSLIAERLPDLAGQELRVVSVEYPPGGASPPHRHDAYVVVYVLSGVLTMQVEGRPAVTLKPGDTFIERPPDVHAVSRNASETEPARFLAIFVKRAEAPATAAAAPTP